MILFINSWLTFYHQGHEVAEEYRKDILQDVQLKIQKVTLTFDLHSLTVTLCVCISAINNL